MCKKQTSFSHSSTESEIISLDAGLRLDGIPAVDLWDLRSSDQDDHRRKESHNETCFQDPQSCAWLVVRSNQLGPTNPNQVRRQQKPTCWHPNQRKFHTWWVESFVVLVQYQRFQFYSVLWNNGEKISTRFRRRTSHSKIATNDEPYCKGSVERIILDFSKPRERKLWKSKSLEYNCCKRGEIRATWYRQPFIESFSSASYSKWDDNLAWSSQEWKTDTETCERSERPDVTSWGATRESQPGFSHEETQHDGTAQSVVNEVSLRERSGRPDVIPQREARPQQFVIGNDEAELELTVESRSFVNSVNDQVRKRQKRIPNVTEDEEKHSIIWGMFMTVTMESAGFMGKNYLNGCQSIENITDPAPKQMFDVSTRLVSEQDEISGLETAGWENHSWKYLSLIGDERVINLQRTKVYVFSDSVLCLGRIHQNPESNKAWEQRIGWITSSQSYRDFDGRNGEPAEFDWNLFPGFDTLQLCGKVKRLLFRSDETPENFTGTIIFMSMFNDISCGTRDNEQECLANARLVSLYARRFGKGQWSFIGPGSEKKVVLYQRRQSTRNLGQNCRKDAVGICWKRMSSFPCYEPSVQRSTQKQRTWKTFVTLCSRFGTVETIFRIIVSVNQLSLYGAVAEMCEEYESLHDRSGQPVVGGQSSFPLVLSVIKTEVLLHCDDPAKQDLLLQQYGERIEKLSQQDKLSKFCMDAGFLSVVENGQYFVTKDTAYLSQFHAVACREYTLPREEPASQPRGWIHWNTKIGPVLEVATSYLHGKYGVEIRIWSLNRDNTHSWVRISHGSNKFVMNLNSMRQKCQKISSKNMRLNWMQKILHADERLKQNHKEENLLALLQEQFLLGEGIGLTLNQGSILPPIMKYRRK